MRLNLDKLLLLLNQLRVVTILKWSLIVGITFSIATTFLFFLAPSSPKSPAITEFSFDDNSTKIDLELVISKNLFGISSGMNGPTNTDISSTSETRLPIELLGIFASENTSRSSAIIAETGKPGVIYSEGDIIPGGVKIAKVHPEYILLQRKTILERLTFPKPKSQDFVINTNDIILERNLHSVQEKNQELPVKSITNRNLAATLDGRNKMLEQLGMNATSVGKAKGYRVGGLVNSPYLSQTGLQPGDLILSVNGQPVGDIEKDKMEIDNIMAQGSARLEIQRGTRTFFVTATL